MWLTAPAGAQTSTAGQVPASNPRSVAGRCGSANWVCVSQCIDSSCVDRCLAKGCEEALAALTQCAQRSGCGAEDSACVARVCGKQCERSFEPAPPSPEKEKPQPCEDGSVNAKVPKKLVGIWSLEAASVKPEERAKLTETDGGTADVKPRADYDRILEVTPNGCFLLRTKMEAATLGKGNDLEVRGWGALQVNEKDNTLELATKDGQAVGTVCGKPRVIGLSKGRFERPAYGYLLEGDTLSLTAKTASKQTFQFRKQPPEKAK